MFAKFRYVWEGWMTYKKQTSILIVLPWTPIVSPNFDILTSFHIWKVIKSDTFDNAFRKQNVLV